MKKNTKEVPKRYAKVEGGKKRLIKEGDLLVKSNNQTGKVIVEDGELKVIFRGKVVDIDLTKYIKIFTPKMDDSGEPITRLSQYNEKDLKVAKVANLV